MAVTAATLTTDFSGFLNPAQSAPIFEKAAEMSVVQQLAPRVELGPTGTAIPIVTGELSASWVAEAGVKPASAGALSLVTMTPKKLAVIAIVSAETVRVNPGGYMDLIRTQVASAFARAFDAAALHGTSTPFDDYLDETTKAVEIGGNTAANGGVWQDLVGALDLLVTDNKELNGWALDTVLEPNLLGAVDTTGRPIFVDTPLTDTTDAAARPGRLMGRRSFMSKYVGTTNNTTVVGYGGDWTQAAWGAVGGINYRISTEAAVTINGSLQSLWERNLVAVLAEAEYGWVVNDLASFVRLTNLTGS